MKPKENFLDCYPNVEKSGMFPYNELARNTKIIKAKIYYRAIVCYPQMTPLPCKIKGCVHKKRNGRCGLKECRLELDEDENPTGICLCFTSSLVKNETKS